MAAPTVAEVAAALDATVVTGGEAALDRDVLDYVVGGAHVPGRAGPPGRRRAGDHAGRPGRRDRRGARRARRRQRHPGRHGADHRRVPRPARGPGDRAAEHRPGHAGRADRQLPHHRGGRRGSSRRLSAGHPAQGRGGAGRVREARGHRRADPAARRDPVQPGHAADVRERPDRPGPRRPPAPGAARGHRRADPARHRDAAAPRRRRPDAARRPGRDHPPGARARAWRSARPGWSTRRPAAGATTSPSGTPSCANTGRSRWTWRTTWSAT